MTSRRTVTAHPGQQSIAFSREFAAPAALLYRAHVEPGLFSQWTGPAGTEVWMREWEARTGGAWSYVVAGNDGEWGFHGTFHEVTEPQRIVQTFESDDNPGHPSLEILQFTNLGDGQARLDGLSLFPTVDDRDAMLSELDSGMDENFDRLEALLASGDIA